MSTTPSTAPTPLPLPGYPWPRTGQRYVFSHATLAVHGLYEFLTLHLVAARLWCHAGPAPVVYSATWLHDRLISALGLTARYAPFSQADLAFVGYPLLGHEDEALVVQPHLSADPATLRQALNSPDRRRFIDELIARQAYTLGLLRRLA